MKPWLVEGKRRDGRVFSMIGKPDMLCGNELADVGLLRDLLIINNIYDAVIVTPSSNWFCVHRGFLFDLDADPAAFFPQPEWPFNEFRKEKL